MSYTQREDEYMMKLILELMGFDGAKEVEYRYVFTPGEGGRAAAAVCVG